MSALADEARLHRPGAGARELSEDRARSSTAAAATGAEAIHPGYGFLSENADFAEACEQAGLRLHRPAGRRDPRHGLEKRGQDADGEGRRAGRARLSRRGPGRWRACAPPRERIGFPVLIKAAAGGGGKGMRVRRGAPSARRGARVGQARGGRPPSATIACSSRSTSRGRATSRSRSSPTRTAMSFTSSSATARSSAATRR